MTTALKYPSVASVISLIYGGHNR